MPIKVDKWYEVDEKTGCWNWLRATISKARYGCLRINKVCVPAHRVYWERKYGQIPDGYEIDHLCRNTRCVNPEHLEPVPRAVNVQRGLKSKVNPKLVREIRKLYKPNRRTAGPVRDAQSKLAKELTLRFGISRDTLYDIAMRITWKNIE